MSNSKFDRTRDGRNGKINVIAVVLISVFTTISVLMLFQAIRDVCRGYSTKSWVIVDGKINKSQMTGRQWRDRVNYYSDIEYKYDWAGQEMVGSNVRINGDTVFSGKTISLDDDLVLYPLGKKVAVYVNPEHPSDSLLEPGARWQPIIFNEVIPGVCAMLASLGVLLFMGVVDKPITSSPGPSEGNTKKHPIPD